MIHDLTILVPNLLRGAVVSIGVSVIALGIGLLVGIIIALMRVYGVRPLAWLAAGYSTVIRSAPSLLVVLILYFVVARVVNLPAFWAGAFALGISSSAYQSEIFRGAILSVPQGQMLAALSLGFDRGKAIRHIILPQALRHALAAWSNEAALVLKDSSLVYVLGVPEILRQAQYFSARTYKPLLAFGSAAALYFLLTFATNRSLGSLERRIAIPGELE